MLLFWMGVCAVGAAEKHCMMPCVIIVMGDVVVDYTPVLSDILELVAVPTLAGRTTIEVSLTATARNYHKDRRRNERRKRRRICTANFTLLIRGAKNGNKVCPPIPVLMDAAKRAQEFAEFRKSMLQVERESRFMSNARLNTPETPTDTYKASAKGDMLTRTRSDSSDYNN